MNHKKTVEEVAGDILRRFSNGQWSKTKNPEQVIKDHLLQLLPNQQETIEDIEEECEHTIKWGQSLAPTHQPDHVTSYAIGRVALAKDILSIIKRNEGNQ